MRLFCCLAVVAVLLSLACGVGAETVENSVSIPWTATNWFESLSLARFDSSLGTLTSATIDLSGGLSGFIYFLNTDSEAQTIQVTQNGAELFILPDGSGWAIDYSYAGPFSTPLLVEPEDGYSAMPGNSDTHQWTTIDTSVLNLLSGSGDFVIPLSASGVSTYSSSGNFDTVFMLRAEGAARVTYTYTPATAVPEAGSVGLALSGLVSIAGLLRLRRRKGVL